MLSSYMSFRFPKVKKALGKKRLDLINGSTIRSDLFLTKILIGYGQQDVNVRSASCHGFLQWQSANTTQGVINYQKILFDSWLTLITELSIHNPLYEVNTTFRHLITHFSVKIFTLTQKVFFSSNFVKKC